MGTSPTHEEQAAMVFSVSYLEQQALSAAGGESVSCYRSAGAVPIPTRRSSVIEPKPKPPKPRKLSLPESFAESALMNWSLEMAPILEAGHGKAIKIHGIAHRMFLQIFNLRIYKKTSQNIFCL